MAGQSLRNQVSRPSHDFHHTMEILRRTIAVPFPPGFACFSQNMAQFDVLR